MFSLLFLSLLVLSALIASGFALYALRHQETPGARSFALMLLGCGLYAVGYLCELTVTTLPAKVGWDNMQFTAIDIAIMGMLLFALDYTGRTRMARRLWLGFPGLLLLNAIIIWTHPVHHLVRSSPRLMAYDHLLLLFYTYEPWFVVWFVYSLLIALIAISLMAATLIRTPRFYKLQVGAALAGMSFGLISSFITMKGLIPIPDLAYLDITPIAFVLGTPLMAWAIFRQRFLDLVPVAHDRLVEYMPDGLLVVDRQHRILDINPRAGMLLQCSQLPVIGMFVEELLPTFASLLQPELIHTVMEHGTPVNSSTAAGLWLEVHSIPLHTRRGQRSGWMLILRDRTEHWQMEQALRAQNARLEQEIADRHRIEEAYRNLVNHSLQGLMILQAGQVVFANPAIETIHGYMVAELLAMSAADLINLIHPEDRPHVQQRMYDYATGKFTAHRHEHRIVCKSGQTRWVEIYVAPVDFQGQQAFQLTFIDITERKQAEEALRSSEAKYRSLIEHTHMPIMAFNADGRLLVLNQAAAQALGGSPEELVGKTLHACFPAAKADIYLEYIRRVIATGQPVEREESAVTPGGIRWFLTTLWPLPEANLQAATVQVIVYDITAHKHLALQLQQVNEDLHEQSIRDALTGLYNRRYLDEMLPRALQRAEQYAQPVGVIMLDIDHFKHFNDTYGHDLGDILLRAVGTFLKSSIRNEDMACRYGGEEFTLVLPGANLTDTRQRAEEIRTGMQSLMVQYQGLPLDPVTVSVGVAIFPLHGTHADTLIKVADMVLYQAKRNGRDRVEVAQEVGNVSFG